MAASDGGHVWPPRASDLRIQELTGAGPEGSTPDDVFAALRAAGFTGSLDDMWKQHLAALGITDTSEPFTDSLALATGDPEFANVQLLAGLDNEAVDASQNAFTLVKRAGNPAYDLVDKQVNSTASYQGTIAVNGGVVITPAPSLPSPFNLGANDWTIEMWYYENASPGSGDTILSNIDFTDKVGYEADFSGGNITFRYYHSGGTLTNVFTGQGIDLQVWTHLVFQRKSNVFELYRSGTRVYTTAMAQTFDDLTAGINFCIGAEGGGSNGVNANFEQFRVTVGVARYSDGYTVPTEPFPTS